MSFGGLLMRPHHEGRVAVVEAHNISVCKAALAAGECQGVVVESERSGIHSVAQLLPLNQAQILVFRLPVQDLQSLLEFPNLGSLALDQPPKGLEISALRSLKRLFVHCNGSSFLLAESPSLTSLHANGLKVGKDGEWGLKVSRALRELSIVQCGVPSLDGVIGDISGVTQLELAYCPKVRSVKRLTEFSALVTLDIQSMKNVQDWSALATLKGLSKLKLSGCGNVRDLNFVKQLPALNFFTFVETPIESGDLSPLLESDSLKYVGFLNKRNFSHSLEEIAVQLDLRNSRRMGRPST